MAVNNENLALRVVFLVSLVLASFYGVWLVWDNKPDYAECRNVSLGGLINGILPEFLGGLGDPRGVAVGFKDCADTLYERNFWYLILMIGSLYIVSQSFAMPGPPTVLSFVAGAAFGPWLAQIFIALCATTGASICYGLSKIVASPILLRYVPDRISWFRDKVNEQKDNIFLFILSLRLTPAAPNWLINMASPIVGVSIVPFFIATFFGLIPTNIVQAYIGHLIVQIAKYGREGAGDVDIDKLQRQMMVGLACIATIPLVPVMVRKYKAAKLKSQ